MTARVRTHAERPRARPARTGRRPESLPTSPAERVALPYRDRLEARFGRPLDMIPVFSGPDVAAALRPYGAAAATHGGRIFLADPHPPLPVVAHEVVHVLQPEEPGGSGEIEAAGSPAEREAEAVAATVAASSGTTVAPVQGLRRDAVALLRLSPVEETPLPVEPVAAEPVPEEPVGAEPVAPASKETAGAAAGPPSPETAAAPPLPGAGEAILPAAPPPTIDTARAAAQQAAAAQAMTAATTSAGLLEAFAAAPPTAKARQAAMIGTDLARLATGEANAVSTDVPDLRARLGGGAEPAAPEAVLAPAARTVDLDTDEAAPAPQPEIADTPALDEFRQAEDVSASFNRFTTAEPAVLADQIGESLDTVQTSDPDVPRSSGPPPTVPLGGETDPALLAQAQSTARGEADTAREEATRAVLDGPGPERVQPRSLDEPFAIGELPAAEITTPVAADAAAGPDGPQAYLAMNLPPEVQASFDEQQQAAMQASLTGAVGQAEQAGVARDEAKQKAVADAETGAGRLATTAGGKQADAVTAAHERIQGARQDTLDKQQREVDRVAADADGRRQADEEKVKTRIADDQLAIDDAYAKAETKIDEKAAEGDRKAAEEKAKAERDAQEQSWWDRAVGFIKDAFNALVDAIGAIFDAIRAAVNAILDAVKAVALAIIDAAAAFVKGAIRVFAAVLKAAVEGLIGQILPELAAALTRAIDDAAAAAERAVDQVADGLKAGVNALVEGLRAGLMAVIGAFQSAITIAIAVAEAAVTGDWGALARKVLEAVLGLVGVDPATFYGFVGRAQETWQIIIDDPGAFLGNLLDAVSGGVQRFADNFGTHLQAGLIGWLTGALGGGIVLPEKFDLLGVLDIARQILGLTWERLRATAATLIGAQNAERLEVVYEFISTLVTEGWGALWAKITEFVATARDVVFDAIRSFLVERMVMAAITKLATLFNPIGAIVQLVLTAWNFYTFLRDQLSRIGAIVVTIVNFIGDIARGVLDGAAGAVEGVLARLLPIAIDLLARILGLVSVAEDVRKIIERIQGMVDAGIAAVLKRVGFTGGGKAGATQPPTSAVAAAQAGAAGPKSPTVKQDALDDAARRLRSAQLSDPAAIKPVIDDVFRMFQPRGLTSLRFDVTDETTLASRLVATASAPEQRSITWTELFGKGDPDRVLFETQPRYETHAAISLDGRKFGEVQLSEKGRHAEVNLLNAHWAPVLAEAAKRLAADPEVRPTVAIAINRAPCHMNCTPTLVGRLEAVDPALRARIRFVLAPTGLYEPTEALTKKVIDEQKAELRVLADRLGRSEKALLGKRLNQVRLTDDTTTMSDLQELVGAGWEIYQLKVKPGPLKGGRLLLAEVAHEVTQEAEKAKAGSA
jgi:hypothetical protein